MTLKMISRQQIIFFCKLITNNDNNNNTDYNKYQKSNKNWKNYEWYNINVDSSIERTIIDLN